MMDRPSSFGELAGALRAITQLNRFFGGRRLTLRHVGRLLAPLPADKLVTVLDVGAGAADIPVALVRWARRAGRRIRVLALDRDGVTLTYARRYAAAYPEIATVQGDALALPVRPGSVDVVISAMTLHDGPLSILRSYTPPEVLALCEKAGLFDVTVAHYPMLFRQCAMRVKP